MVVIGAAVPSSVSRSRPSVIRHRSIRPAAVKVSVRLGSQESSAKPPAVVVRPPVSRRRVGLPATKVKRSRVEPLVVRASPPSRSSSPAPTGGRSSIRPPIPVAGTAYWSSVLVAAVRVALTLPNPDWNCRTCR